MNNFAKLGCTLLIGLAFAFWPSGASSVEAASAVSVYPETSYTGEDSGTHMAVYVVNLANAHRQFLITDTLPVGYSRDLLVNPRGDLNNVFVNFPRAPYENILGLDIYLVGEDGKKINLKITGITLESFGISGDRLIVEYPAWTASQIGDYDLVLVSPGTTSVLKSAVHVLEAPVGGDEEETVVVTPEVVKPEISISKSSTLAPAINSFIPSPGVLYGSTIAIEGYGWPNTAHGLEVTLVDKEDNGVYACTTLSYVPERGYLLVQVPTLPMKKNHAYDIVVYPKASGAPRTTIHNGWWVTG